MIINVIAALVAGYLLGSIPVANIASYIFKGKDIRRLGSGNIGTLNTLKTVGRLPALLVLLLDMGKGAVAVAVAFWLLALPPVYVMLAGVTAVAGHLWMVFLKFAGGRGIATAIGSSITVFGVYSQWTGLFIFVGIGLVSLIITHNVPLSSFIDLGSLPFIAWLAANSITGALVALALGLLVGGKFLPTAIAAWQKAKTKRAFFFPPG